MKTAKQAVEEAIEAGEEVHEAVVNGETVKQRPVSLDVKPKRGRPVKGKKVKVYNKIRAKLFTSDGFIEPEGEGYILESELAAYGDKVIKL